MAKPKYDGVVEVVHLKPDGQVDWVRAYLRRGAAFSDHIMLDRPTLVEQIKSGKRYLTGKRIPLMAGSFEVDQPLRVVQKNGKEVLVTGELQSEQDRLEGVPVI
jgi:hypothetical protein